MKTTAYAFAAALVAVSSSAAFGEPQRVKNFGSAPLTLSADSISVDRSTGNMVASGGVRAVSKPLSLHSRLVVKDGDTYKFAPGTSVTTCTNELCKAHWRATGEFEYIDNDRFIARDVTFRFYEIPVMWTPYWFYPFNTDYGWRVTPGYMSGWGAYLLTKYVYDIAGGFGPGQYGLRGATRLDLRSRNGVALGQSVRWQLGDKGRGKFKVYYAWDEDADRYDRHWTTDDKYHYENWGSDVSRERYALMLEHSWDVTERDIFRIKGAYMSDSYFYGDFLRDAMFGSRNRFAGSNYNEMALEHNENSFGAGVSVSSPLNDFYPGVSRLPEAFVEVMPQPVFSLPVNYESRTVAGWYNRDYATYGKGTTALPFRYSPGQWADYQAFRLDSYHRFTMPFMVEDVVSVVPRFGVRGTFWSDSAVPSLDGRSRTNHSGKDVFRTIVEGGVTFSARAEGEVAEDVKHVFEPYVDFLAQEAIYSGARGGRRPYVFDSADGSRDWLDQFAGRSRELPYSWYGVTPGARNTFAKLSEKGEKTLWVDFDVYAAVQFNKASFTEGGRYHRLHKAANDPVEGRHSGSVMPGFRTAVALPEIKASLSSRVEFDTCRESVAYADISWRHNPWEDLSYSISYISRDHRLWDFSSSPYDPLLQQNENFNWADFAYLDVEFEHDICDWLAWGPFVRWDVKEGEFDEIGSWIDYRTDCLGFRFMVAYENECTRIDRSTTEHDWRFGFFIYLRAMGPGSGSAFR